MGCGCRGSASAAVTAAAITFHYVVDADGAYTGRRYTSLLAADTYARSIGGSVVREQPVVAPG